MPHIDVLVAGTVQSTAGAELQANLVATNADVLPSLGRPLSGGIANTTAPMMQPGDEYGDRINQLDFRVAKLFRFSTGPPSVNFDFTTR